MYSYNNKYAAQIVAPNRDRILMSDYTRYERKELLKLALAATVFLAAFAISSWHSLGGL